MKLYDYRLAMTYIRVGITTVLYVWVPTPPSQNGEIPEREEVP